MSPKDRELWLAIHNSMASDVLEQLIRNNPFLLDDSSVRFWFEDHMNLENMFIRLEKSFIFTQLKQQLDYRYNKNRPNNA